jgi:hypothetical protein
LDKNKDEVFGLLINPSFVLSPVVVEEDEAVMMMSER